ncbi:PAS domain S-box-containing protein [Catalinimonas alkaloidigena]|uniref:PAS domain S-box protein n=1 Tax=Catalinimonas alkaloidigena TaxID=1075417 RepID=UPI002406F9CF|nr:PAS domain S-box protein [Catalinimonas alkaloidigena]MDF9799811.1 PAS domain S-box-containing protein [Catalinimonas alkaloidigena]
MFKKINISSKITGLVLTVVLITVVAISFTAYNLVNRNLQDQYLRRLEVITRLKKSQLETFFGQQKSGIKELVVAFSSAQVMESINSGESEDSTAAYQLIANETQKLLRNNTDLHHIYLLDTQGKILYTNDDDPVQQAGEYFASPDVDALNHSLSSIYFSNIYQKENAHFLAMGMPLSSHNGILMTEIKAAPVFSMVNDTTGLGESGEIILSKKYKNKAICLNPSRHIGNAALAKGVTLGDVKQKAMQRAAEMTAGASIDKDYREKAVLASWDYIPIVEWGIISKIDTDEIQANLQGMIMKFLIAGAIVVLVALLISIVFSRFLIGPLLSLKEIFKQMNQGILPESVVKHSDDEIGQMAEVTGQFAMSLRRTAEFAHEIGEGDFDSEFTPLSEEDTLGNALINMRNSIQESEKRDRERNWIVTGVAEIGDILRSHNNLEELGDEVVAYVTKKINAIQGAFYVVNDEDKDNTFIEMKASYAYNKKKHLKGRFKFAEGLVGQSAIEQDTILRTEIPYEYVSVTSGLLGDQRPEALLIVPLIANEEVYGVLEFAGFEKFSARDVKFVEEISLIIARTVFNIKVNEKTRNLLSESQKMSNELQEQQEVLRQNAEEMQATQEELQRSNQQLEEQVNEVERTQKRMASLLENASEVITIYEENGNIRYISPSVERIFGYSQQEMIGQSDLQYIKTDGVEVFSQMFQTLLDNPKESVTVQYVYQTKDNSEVWVETTGNNLLDDPAVNGIVLNSRDITERKRAEQEERMRSKMQALSENSPDLITRFDQEGTFFYINPTIETYTGKKPDHFLHKHIDESGLNSSVVEQWLQILNDVKETQGKVAKEIGFPAEDGEHIMHVNAIPEFDEGDSLESVLVVSHDITERKLIELEIQNKNKKINDSINYAQRIQGAILPDNRIIRSVFPESFIFYKAKDVVSGDFPWFLQRGEDMFIAAVDCTGHGVPGALISLIGYFLLNDIVRSRKITEPGEILDQLDEGVTQTLRQDSDGSKSKDGMDISLCRINKNQVQYAGAHRPLYHMQKGEMNEIKGDKFPIGGGIFKNQTNFTTHTLKMSKGDSIYFCSDGFPDQFGGPDNRKFGPKRTRALIEENHTLPMDEVHNIFASTWEEWQGEEKQTDDVLMIGIKF